MVKRFWPPDPPPVTVPPRAARPPTGSATAPRPRAIHTCYRAKFAPSNFWPAEPTPNSVPPHAEPTPAGSARAKKPPPRPRHCGERDRRPARSKRPKTPAGFGTGDHGPWNGKIYALCTIDDSPPPCYNKHADATRFLPGSTNHRIPVGRKIRGPSTPGSFVCGHRSTSCTPAHTRGQAPGRPNPFHVKYL